MYELLVVLRPFQHCRQSLDNNLIHSPSIECEMLFESIPAYKLKHVLDQFFPLTVYRQSLEGIHLIFAGDKL